MQLILWRHTQAEEGDNDLARPLTAKGISRHAKWRVFCKGNCREAITFGYRKRSEAGKRRLICNILQKCRLL